jgi:hypothetical protein
MASGVEETGIGLDARIFDALFTTRPTGMGLSIANTQISQTTMKPYTRLSWGWQRAALVTRPRPEV